MSAKAFGLTIARALLAFLPIISAPYLLHESQALINFYRLQLGFSIVAAVITLGMSSYVYILSAELEKSYRFKEDFWCLMNLFKLNGLLVFFGFIIAALVDHNIFYIQLAFFVPISYFVVQQQIGLAKGWHKKTFFSFLLPPSVFMFILLFSWVLGDTLLREIAIAAPMVTSIFLIRKFGLMALIKIFSRKANLKKFIQYLRTISVQVINSAIVAVCAPLSTLFIIDWVAGHQISNHLISTYYFYARLVDALVSFGITYLLAYGYNRGMQNLIRSPYFSASKFFLVIFVAYWSVNLSVDLVFGSYYLLIAILEFVTGILRFMLAILTISFLKQHPNLIGTKEAFMCFAIWLLSSTVVPYSIVEVQIYVLVVVAITLSFLGGGIYFSKKRLVV